MGVREIERFLQQWQMGVKDLRRRMILAPTPRERERWYAILLLAQGWTSSATGAGPGAGSSHHRTMGVGLREGRARSPDLRADRGFPPALDEAQQAELKAAVQELPDMADIELANWNWKVVRQFLLERCSVSLCRSSCLNYLHRLEFAFKRPKKRLLKADETKREAFVAEYAALWDEAGRTGAKIFFADEAHFRADAELRGKWVLKGEPALVDSSSPRHGEKANYYSAVCLETGEVEWMELEGNSNGESSVAFLEQLRGEARRAAKRDLGQCAGAPRSGDAVILGDPGPESAAGEPPFSRGQALPGYSPDFNADEAVWGWVREEATGNQCLGTKALVQKRVNHFLERAGQPEG